MKVVILAGGFGTRIRDVSEDVPKPMIPIGPYPILWHIMKIYAGFGHKEFVVCLGHKGNVIKDFFLNLRARTRNLTVDFANDGEILFHDEVEALDWKVTLVDTGQTAMTGARIGAIREYIGDEDFMLTYGDGVSDVDIGKLVAFHKDSGRVLTVTGVRPPGRFGEIVANETGIVSGFNEKPQTSGGRISGGFFVATSKLFDYLEDRDDLVFEQEPVNAIVADGQLAMYSHDGFWQPMDTSREYRLLNDLYKSGNSPWLPKL
ncbi:glucose-1-phosphate cytidylyltransferase [Pontivivens insulae]|uniref:Glucose-1-phosphate cytidylyltransferase n=1 Tax=Pontivivens insulae TaxID=1639689 RepID=A0A2R8A7F6_9RHOB|nr:glucose-1-phosphate cytidylyltransferase [Pontivivens insulae]RED18269.1 glucose-1-phosphate cytidylyltransferase [Pontivivens insulae]SPF28167.1 Glucose-1-phosphate cytidylyltransferase [Pontivivens insulae]